MDNHSTSVLWGREGPLPVSQRFLGKEDTLQLSGITCAFSEASGRPISPLCIPSCACSWASRGRLEITAVKNKAESMIGSHLTYILKVKMDAHTGKKPTKSNLKL